MLNSPRGANPPTKNPRLLRWKFTLLLEALEIHIWILVGWRTGSFAASLLNTLKIPHSNNYIDSVLLYIYTSKPCYCKPTIAVRTYDHFISLVMQETFATFQEPPAQQSSPPLWGTDMSQPFFWAQHDRQKVTWNGRMSKCAKTMDGWSRRFTFVLGVMVNFLNTSCLCLLLKDFNGSRDVQVQHSLLDRLNKRGSLQRRCWLPNPGCWCQESLLPVFEGPCQPVNLPNSLGWGVTHHHIPGVSSTNILLTSEPFCRKSWDWWHVLAIWGEHQLKLKKTFRQNHSQIGNGWPEVSGRSGRSILIGPKKQKHPQTMQEV